MAADGAFVMEVRRPGVPDQTVEAHGVKVGRSDTPGGVVIVFGAAPAEPVRTVVELPPAAVAPLVAALRSAGLVVGG